MKKLSLIVIALLLCGSSLCAQSATTSFMAAGIKVIFKPTSKRVINIRMYYRGGVTNYPASQAGIESLTLDAATRCGTKKYSANAYRDTAGKYDIALSGSSYYDYGYIQVNCISRYFDKGWDLFTEAVVNPVFDATEVNKAKTATIALLKTDNSDPEVRLNKIQMKNAFAHTPYETDPDGNEQTLASLNADDLKNYYKILLNKNKLFIVVVGNITKEDLYQKILAAFDQVPVAAYSPLDLTPPVWTDNKLTIEQSKDLKLDYVSAIMPAPAFTSNDYVPFRLAVSGLGGNLFMILRNTLNLSYNPGSVTVPLKMPYAAMTASTSSPKEVMTEMVTILKEVQNHGFDEEWLQHIKNGYITNSYVNDQSAAQITSNLGLAEVLGNWQYADDLPQLVSFVTVEQVNRAITLYITGLRWTYFGNPDDINGYIPTAY